MKTLTKNKEYRKLHAEWYDLVSGSKDQTAEINYWTKCIKESGEPALELGSGTGRIYIPLLECGFDITGIDTSEDMMNRCRETCSSKGLNPDIDLKSMLDFRLPRKFGLIFLDSGGLGLFDNNNDIEAMFERVMEHLKPGGLFIFEFEPVPVNYKWSSNNWIGDWIECPDDTIIAWRQRRKYNSSTHVWKCLFVIEKFINGCLTETEANERTGRYFTIEEAVSFAIAAGFENIKITDWLTEEPPKKESEVITVKCRKPG
jgi:SAM-dependent methyltransferase